MNIFVKLVVASSLVSLGTPAIAEDNPQVSAEIMALARAQWTAEMSDRPVAEQMSSIADDYTEFNQDYPTRIDGKATNARFYEALSGGPTSLVGDMMNARVQTYGDTAILTYNYVGVVKGQDGELTPSNAKSTRVYHKQNGRWMLVHANFAPISAPAN